jgi:hypothetical protein
LIAKRIQRRGNSDFRKLARYILDDRGNGHKLLAAWTVNCSDDLDIAVAEISATQALNTRSKADKTYHLVVSFPATENPSLETISFIEERLTSAIGMDEHHRLVAVHQDTEHVHFHVALSKVHPTSFNNIEPYYDKIKLQKVCRELEHELGLTKLNPSDGNEKGVPEKPMDTHKTFQSFQSWIAEHLKPAISEFFTTSDQPKTWEEFHWLMADYGVAVKLRGAGLVFAHASGSIAVKPSEIDRSFSKPALEKVLGKYMPVSQERAGPPKHIYEVSPRSKNPESEKLYAEYTAERDEAWREREKQTGDARIEYARHVAQLRARHHSLRMELRSDPILSQQQKRSVSESYAGSFRKDLGAAKDSLNRNIQRVREEIPLVSWDHWLHARAETGDESSLKALRRRQKAPSKGSNILQGTEEKTQIALEFKKTLLKHGTLKITTKGEGSFLDKGSLIHVLTPNDQTIEASIHYAIEKFGVNLRIDGSKEFVATAEQILFRIKEIGNDRNPGNNPGGVADSASKKLAIKPRERVHSPIKPRKGPEL